jgi:hypothetical protein
MVAGRTEPPPVVPGSLWPSTRTGDEAAAVPAEGLVVADGVVTDKLGVGVVAGATELAATDDELSAGVLALDTLLLAAHPASSRHEAMYAGLARRDISQRLAGIDHAPTPNRRAMGRPSAGPNAVGLRASRYVLRLVTPSALWRWTRSALRTAASTTAWRPGSRSLAELHVRRRPHARPGQGWL